MKKHSKVGKRPGAPAYRTPAALRNKLLTSQAKTRAPRRVRVQALKKK